MILKYAIKNSVNYDCLVQTTPQYLKEKLRHLLIRRQEVPTLNMLSAEGFKGNCWLDWRGRYIYQSHPAIGNTRVHCCSVQEQSRKLHLDERLWGGVLLKSKPCIHVDQSVISHRC